MPGFEPGSHGQNAIGLPLAPPLLADLLSQGVSFQGRVFFDIPLSKVEEVLKLRCVDNIWVLIGVWPKVDFDLKETPQVWAFLAGAVTPY